METHYLFWETHYQWPFSILATLNFQRVKHDKPCIYLNMGFQTLQNINSQLQAGAEFD